MTVQCNSIFWHWSTILYFDFDNLLLIGLILRIDETKGDGEQGLGQQDQEQVVPAFKEFELTELRAATNGFSSELIVSESGEKAPNVVYRGKLRSNKVVAIKRFSKLSWPDPQQFVVCIFHTHLHLCFLGLFFWFDFQILVLFP